MSSRRQVRPQQRSTKSLRIKPNPAPLTLHDQSDERRLHESTSPPEFSSRPIALPIQELIRSRRRRRSYTVSHARFTPPHAGVVRSVPPTPNSKSSTHQRPSPPEGNDIVRSSSSEPLLSHFGTTSPDTPSPDHFSLRSTITIKEQTDMYHFSRVRLLPPTQFLEPRVSRSVPYDGTVFIDLDNCLVYCEQLLPGATYKPFEYVFSMIPSSSNATPCDDPDPYAFSDDPSSPLSPRTRRYGVTIRPYALRFLRELRQLNVEIILYTSASASYCHQVTRILQLESRRSSSTPPPPLFDRILSRLATKTFSRPEHKIRIQVKDIGFHCDSGEESEEEEEEERNKNKRNLSRAVLIDDSPHNFALFPRNGILVRRWMGGFEKGEEFEFEFELKNVLRMIRWLFNEFEDIRVGIEEMYGFKKKIQDIFNRRKRRSRSMSRSGVRC